MRKFIKKPDITFAVIPGVGRIVDGQVLEGDQYAKFVPSLLVELEESKAVSVSPSESKPTADISAPAYSSEPPPVVTVPALDAAPTPPSRPSALEPKKAESKSATKPVPSKKPVAAKK